jgi:hypothetical protein
MSSGGEQSARLVPQRAATVTRPDPVLNHP